jgi:hypothetical protein
LKRMIKIGLGLLVLGIGLVIVSIPLFTEEVALHETVGAKYDHVSLGPFELEAGTYTVWIEDYHKDGLTHYATVLEPTSMDGPYTRTVSSSTTQEFDGIECLEAGRFTDVESGDWRLIVDHWPADHNDTGTIEVYMVRQHVSWVPIMFTAGLAMACIGAVLFAIPLTAKRLAKDQG